MTMDDETPAESLRAWAKGVHPIEAGTELLIRGHFAQARRPWVNWDSESGLYWIDFEHIPELMDAVSGGEGRFLRIAASIGADVPVILGDEIPGLDRRNLALVLSALAHANGAHETGRSFDADGRPQIIPPMNVWGDEDE